MSGGKPKKVVKTAGSLLPDNSQSLSQRSLMHDSINTATENIMNESWSTIENDGPNTTNTTSEKVCEVCKQTDATSNFEVNILQCCGCSAVFHRSGLGLDESVLPFLYVMDRIGGWCCLQCPGHLASSVNRGKSIVFKPQSINSDTKLDTIKNELNDIRSQMESLTDLLHSAGQRTEASCCR